MFVYAQQESTFLKIKDVTKQAPLRVTVYEDNERVIINDNFFFLKYVMFKGKKHSNYSIRFITSGKRKFVALNLKVMT